MNVGGAEGESGSPTLTKFKINSMALHEKK